MEEWRDVIGYEGAYQVSSLGRVKSLRRSAKIRGGRVRNIKTRFLMPSKDRGGYLMVALSINDTKKTRRVHQLVAVAFLDHITCGHKFVVNHKNFDRVDNRVDNLEIITQRKNSNRKHLNSTSKYVGVCWNKRDNKWRSTITVNGKSCNLGGYSSELEASKAYQNKLMEIN